jgi:4-amino-4-deoxy-L-arabinose transferase-like glycosyltransferase
MMQLHNRVVQLRQFSWSAGIVFVNSTLVTLLFWIILPTTFQNINSDYIFVYEPLARNILEGRGFMRLDGEPVMACPPGYPLVLAGIFGFSHFLGLPEEAVHSAFNLLSMSLTSAFVFMLARSIWGPFPALISSLIWMTYPFALWLTKLPSSEIPFMAVFYGGFYLFWYAQLRKSPVWPLYFSSGLVVGVAMLIRPIAIGVGFFMGAILWLVRRDMTAPLRLFLVMMILLGNLVAVLPWEIWAYFATGKVVMLSTSGTGTISHGLTFALPLESRSYRQGVKVPQDIEVLMRDLHASDSEMQSLRGVIKVVKEALQSRPLTVMKLFALKVGRGWYGTDSNRLETPILLIQIPYLALILWSSKAAWKQGGSAKQLSIGIWLIVLYFWGMTTISVSILRYMTPVIGLLFVLVSACFCNKEVQENVITQK